jgi:flagellar hook assembly protein FlgD
MTIIQFEIPQNSAVELSIYNMLGQKIKSLINRKMNSGYHSVYWDGTDNNGQVVSSGLYMYSLVTEQLSKTNKMLFIK